MSARVRLADDLQNPDVRQRFCVAGVVREGSAPGVQTATDGSYRLEIDVFGPKPCLRLFAVPDGATDSSGVVVQGKRFTTIDPPYDSLRVDFLIP